MMCSRGPSYTFYVFRRAEGDEAWCCRQCRQSYDMEAIEQRLVLALNQHVRTYELQVGLKRVVMRLESCKYQDTWL
eukprot:scaffold31015_cov17-Tisochrysis_lutea.AAC.3